MIEQQQTGSECAACGEGRQAAGGLPLRRAAGAPGLEGSRFVGSRGVRDLHVCRACGSLWWSWVDAREGWRGWRSLGVAAVPLYASDTSLARIIDWTVRDYRDSMFRPVHDLTTLVVRRRPACLQEGIDSMLQAMTKLSRPSDEVDAERLTMLFRILALVVARAVRGDLRPPGPRTKPPRRWRDDEVDAEVARFETREEGGLARLALTHDVARRLLWERRWGDGAVSRQTAVIAIDDPSPMARVLDTLPWDVVPDGTRRGVFAKAAFDAVSDLVWKGLLPENDHAVWMRRDDWDALRRRVDPVVRLAGLAGRLLSTGKGGNDSNARIAMEAVLVRDPIRLGARFTDVARGRLAALRGSLDDRAQRTMNDLLELERQALAADANCALGSHRRA